jgi:AcrR family transcriptional regulator
MSPLPRGRHGLSREAVEGSQRTRLLRAMVDVMADKGYAGTSVADILRRARVSRETFYELFSSKEDCFMSAFEQQSSFELKSS